MGGDALRPEGAAAAADGIEKARPRTRPQPRTAQLRALEAGIAGAAGPGALRSALVPARGHGREADLAHHQVGVAAAQVQHRMLDALADQKRAVGGEQDDVLQPLELEARGVAVVQRALALEGGDRGVGDDRQGDLLRARATPLQRGEQQGEQQRTAQAVAVPPVSRRDRRFAAGSAEGSHPGERTPERVIPARPGRGMRPIHPALMRRNAGADARSTVTAAPGSCLIALVPWLAPPADPQPPGRRRTPHANALGAAPASAAARHQMTGPPAGPCS